MDLTPPGDEDFVLRFPHTDPAISKRYPLAAKI